MEPNEIRQLVNTAVETRSEVVANNIINDQVTLQFKHHFLRAIVGSSVLSLCVLFAFIWYLNTSFKEDVALIVENRIGDKVDAVTYKALTRLEEEVANAKSSIDILVMNAFRSLGGAENEVKKAKNELVNHEKSLEESKGKIDNLMSDVKEEIKNLESTRDSLKEVLNDPDNIVEGLIDLYNQAKTEEGVATLNQLSGKLAKAIDLGARNAENLQNTVRHDSKVEWFGTGGDTRGDNPPSEGKEYAWTVPGAKQVLLAEWSIVEGKENLKNFDEIKVTFQGDTVVLFVDPKEAQGKAGLKVQLSATFVPCDE